MTSITIYRGDSVRQENYHGPADAPLFGRFAAAVRQDRVSTGRLADGTWAVYSPMGQYMGDYTEEQADETARAVATNNDRGWTIDREQPLAVAIAAAKQAHNSRVASSRAYELRYGPAVA